jgi:hypothetical protein
VSTTSSRILVIGFLGLVSSCLIAGNALGDDHDRDHLQPQTRDGLPTNGRFAIYSEGYDWTNERIESHLELVGETG